jgi:hypothetical protein
MPTLQRNSVIENDTKNKSIGAERQKLHITYQKYIIYKKKVRRSKNYIYFVALL